MARYRSAMRMGSLNLLVLVVALCLVVLSVLALVSANMMASFTERQEDATTQYYVQESAGQTFLVAVSDGWSRNSGTSGMTQGFADDYVSYALEWANSNRSGVKVSGEAEPLAIEELYGETGIPLSVRGNLGIEEFEGFGDVGYRYSVAEVLDRCSSGMTARFETDSGQRLDIVLGFTEGGKVEVLSWKSSREWEPEETTLLGSEENANDTAELL